MRNKFAELITKAASKEEHICLLYADIGNRLFDKFKSVAPQRAINAGIAEANMTSMASGMTAMGMRPFIYTITPFTTARNFEQIKVDIAYANAPVVIVGTGSGLSYANLGPTHHSFEDIALMRTLPGMQIVCPADSMELEAIFPDVMASTNPVYLRIGKKNEPFNYEKTPSLRLGKAHVLIPGEDVVLLCTGTALNIGLQAAKLLAAKDISVQLVSMHTVKPLDIEFMKEISGIPLWVTIEEHGLIGGFGAAIAEWKVDNNVPNRLMRYGIPDRFIDQVHSPKEARESIDLTPDRIADDVIEEKFGPNR